MSGRAAAWGAALFLAVAGSAQLKAGGLVVDCSEASLLGALSGGGTVTFAGDCTITISQPIYIPSGNSTIIDASGHNVAISGAGAVRLFNVVGNLTLIHVKVINGRASYGGGVYVSSTGTLFATNCTFGANVAAGTNGVAGTAGNSVDNGQGGNGGDGTSGTSAVGGAIFNDGITTLWRCSLTNNSAAAGNGGAGGNGGNGGGSLGQAGDGGNGGSGAAAWGGAVYTRQNLTVIDSTFLGNKATGGTGAAGGSPGTASFPGGNGNGGQGGAAAGAAIYNDKYLVVRSSTFSANTATGGDSAAGGIQSNGAGINGQAGGASSGGALQSTVWGVATNCTFYTNAVIGGAGGDGGPILNGSLSEPGNGGNGGNASGGAVYNANTFIMESCTVANCTARGGTNGVAGAGGFPANDGLPGVAAGAGLNNAGTFTLLNNLFSTNSPGGNGRGTFVDAGHNLSSDNSIVLNSGTSFTQTDPKLGSFGNYGGPAFTMALLSSSPAINAIGVHAAFPATDERGVLRPIGAGADIGAYEFGTNNLVVPVITAPLADSYSVIPGQSITFGVSASPQPLSYQWYFQNVAISNANSAILTITNAQLTNAGIYKVVITNDVGSTNDSTLLKVLAETTISRSAIVSNNFQLVYPTYSNLNYVLQYKNTLKDPYWIGLMNTIGTGTLVTNSDPLTNPPSRFYRIMVK